MTTETLEDYLAGDYHQDMQDIRELKETLGRAANVFIHSCNDGRWPYERRSRHPAGGSELASAHVSHGTQAMIAAALGKMCGLCAMPGGDRARLKLSADEALRSTQQAGLECLLESLSAGQLRSGTFGMEDPITLSHVTELIVGLTLLGDRSSGKKLAERVQNAIRQLATLAKEDPASLRGLIPRLPDFGSRVQDEGCPRFRRPDYVVNAFVPLRIVRCVNNLSVAGIDLRPGDAHPEANLESADFDPYQRYFESTLHDQLSFSAIPDSRFDAAELIFCLEGLLLCGRHAIDSRVFEHVVHILRDKQEISAQWRANRPVFATQQGMTMLPVSVESAVSLVRSIEIMDRRQDYHPFSTLAVPLARRFWRWLRARMVQFRALETGIPETDKFSEFTGWHSEHVNDPGLIHLWDTSQVVEFMLGYRQMLQRSIAGRTLLLSRLKIDLPERELLPDWEDNWKTKALKYEPRLGKGKKIYEDKLTKDFVLPWGRREPANFSILLYGPPGTGKSSLAENLANALGMRMITVTVSDFLGGGGANVEARAKAIFQTLEAQFDTVILFDEIDSFLLDRDSARYAAQDSLFQFLTPGMLTKLNDLRKKERSIFIIATNYANRIDPAIKRRGRIDQHYLLVPPDAQKRLAIIERLRKGKAVAGDLAEQVRKLTLLFGYSDLSGVVKEARARGGTDRDLVDALQSPEYQPSTSIETYLARYSEEQFPFDELLALADLKKEVERDFDIERSDLPHAPSELSEKLKKFKSDLAEAVQRHQAAEGGNDDAPP